MKNTFKTALPSCLFVLLLLVIWQAVSMLRLIPGYLLPSPVAVMRALLGDSPLLLKHLGQTLAEALIGLSLAIVSAFVLAIVMDTQALVKSALLPVLLLTQTVPTIALAPLLVLWLGYGLTPKIVLVFLTCFFPMAVSILGGFESLDPDMLRLFRSMGASRMHTYRYLKIPSALPAFFSGLKIAASYAVIGAVVAEWLGGNAGLGVYMTRVRKSYSFDKMFAVIVIIAVLSFALMRSVAALEKIFIQEERK
ncbi:MAG: ABC transporter permease [Spirochaetaceae bacterium]|jgi:ABC-type nitrate/sulfonate/bicarbonate transport system permease component|nr:ABC transporter permease [Spirochaetaceae bacterium]